MYNVDDPVSSGINLTVVLAVVVCTTLGDGRGTAVIVDSKGGSKDGLLLDEVVPPALDDTCTTLVYMCVVSLTTGE